MTTTYKGTGDRIDYTNAGSAISAGDVIELTDCIGIAIGDIAASTGNGSLYVTGIHALTANASESWTVGKNLYWDKTNDRLTITPSSGVTVLAGIFPGPADKTSTATENVLLLPGAAAREAIALADINDVGVTTATAGRLMVADGDSWESVAVSGDIAMGATGAVTIAAGAVEDSMIEGLADGEFIIGVDGDAANNAKVTMSGEATLANNGALTLAFPAVRAAVTQSLAFGSFTDGGGTSGYIDSSGAQIPAGAMLIGFKAVVSTGFAGDTTAVIEVGVAGDTDRFSSVTDQSVLSPATVGAGAATDASDGMNAAQTIRVTVTGTADFTSISAGVMVVTVYYIDTE